MSAERVICDARPWRGQPGWRVVLPNGDSLWVVEQGAQVLSWQCSGRERLFLSESSAADGQAAIRGGVPVCWPQFNQRGALPKHGFVRHLPWRWGGFEPDGPGARLSLRLGASESSRRLWDSEFQAELVLELQPGGLRLTLGVKNTGAQPWSFTGALHSYFAVDNVADARLGGLDGQPEWDAVRDVHGVAAAWLSFEGEFDRVYEATSGALELREGPHRLRIEQSPSWAQTVVWNPGADRAASLADLPPDGWRRYLCVEAAQVYQPVTVPAGGSWVGWQALTVL